MSFLINGKPLAVDTPFTDAEGNQYPANWLRLASLKEKTAIGIAEVADVDMNFDNRFYWAKDLPKALEDKLEVKEDGTPLMVQVYDPATKSMIDTDKQVVTKGLKSNFISQVKQSAGSILSQTDWMVIRKAERNVDIPASVVAYRAEVVAKADELEAAIGAVTTVEELAALNLSFPAKD
jgi:hypothetical protein